MEWKRTPFGAGVFANEDIAKGTTLRFGKIGRNLLRFDLAEDVVDFCCAGGAMPLAPRVAYVSDYFYGFDPNAEVLDAANPLPWFYGVWIPGNGLNHSPTPNVLYKCARGGIGVGIDLTALTDISSGDELLDDYRRFGPPPPWAQAAAKQLKMPGMNFAGSNDFV